MCASCVVAAAKQLTPYTDVHLMSGDVLAGMTAEASQAEGYLLRAEAAEGRLAELAEFVKAGAV